MATVLLTNSITIFLIKTATVTIPVAIGDAATLQGTVTGISGSGSSANVTALLTSGDSVTVKGSDCYAPQSSGPAISASGKPFGPGDTATIPVYVTALASTSTANVCHITCKTYSGTSVVVTGSSLSVQNAIQSLQVTYTTTATDVTNGYADVPFVFGIPFADTNIIITVGVTDISQLDPLNFYQGDVHAITANGGTARVYLYSPGYGTAGNVIQVNIQARHN